MMKGLARHLPQSIKLRIARGLPQMGRFLEEHFDVHLVRRHYYSPVPDAADLPEGYWDQVSSMPGVDLGLSRGLEIIEKVVQKHIQDFRDRFPLHQEPGRDFFLINGTYMAVDAHVYWCLIQHYEPRRIVEIGAHASTMVSTAAVARLRERTGRQCEISTIEPYPSDFLKREDGSSITLIPKKVQELPIAFFEELEAGDILFIDSTHVLREGSDVQYEYLEVLPRLRPGVLVHVHDVSLPRRYPKVYFDNQIYWNEQHLLQAYLVFNQRVEVIWAGNALMLAYPEVMLAAFPEIADMRAAYPSSEPTAFWMQMR